MTDKNNDKNKSGANNPLQDAQGHWWSQLSVNQIATGDHIQQQPQLQQQFNMKKKNKCRGNRKLQRFRARLSRRGFDVETITMLLNEYNSQHQNEDKQEPFSFDMEAEDIIPLNDQVGFT